MASISVQRERLYLLATLPPRPTAADPAPQGRWRQQRIALKLDDSPANRRVAERRLAELHRQLEAGRFEWGSWLEASEPQALRWSAAIALLRHHKCTLGKVKSSTWDIAYLSLLKGLDPAELCTTETIQRALARYPRQTRSYHGLYHLLRTIARLTGVVFPQAPQPISVQPKALDVPDDDAIVQVLERADPILQWYLGVMGAFGVRPHEVESARFLGNNRLLVGHETKTGERTVVALPPEWVERFQLENRRPRPPLSSRGEPWRMTVARWLWHELKNLDVPWRPYALRHAYAARLWRTGGSRLDLFTAARLMGHSHTLHARTYRAHVDPHTIAAAAEKALFGEP